MSCHIIVMQVGRRPRENPGFLIRIFLMCGWWFRAASPQHCRLISQNGKGNRFLLVAGPPARLDSNPSSGCGGHMLSPWKRLAHALGVAMPATHAHGQRFDRISIEVFARVAHEARQPLAAARVAFELIRRSSDDMQRERAYVVID